MNYKKENSNHQFDTIELEVRLENDRYEKSEVTKNKEGQLVRGYKLNCSRLMLPQGGLIEQISMSSTISKGTASTFKKGIWNS